MIFAVNLYLGCISFYEIPYSICSSLHKSGNCLADLRTRDDRNDDLRRVTRKIRDNTDAESCHEAHSELSRKPCGSEDIADRHSDDHSDYMHVNLCRELLNEEACDRCQKDKSDQVAAGRSEKLADTATKSGEYRKSYCS